MTDKIIWDYLLDKICNPYGVAGLMGNLYVESRLDPSLLQSTYAKKLGMTSAEYTFATDNGSYNNFVNDSAGYGLAQWTFWSRKQALLEYAKSKKVSISDLQMQLDYLWIEIQNYKTVISVLKTAKSVREASDVVLERYEKAQDQSEEGKKRRADYGLTYYKQFAEPPIKKVRILTNRVNIRAGNGKNYSVIIQASKDRTYEWVATSQNDWHAIVVNNRVGWVSGEFSKIE